MQQVAQAFPEAGGLLAGDAGALYGLEVQRLDDDSPASTVPVCLICKEQRARRRFTVALPSTTVYTLVQCVGCGLGRLAPLPTPDELAGFYPADYYGSGGKKFTGLVEKLVRLVGSRQGRFLARRVPAGGRILDVGCGRGVTLRDLAKRGFEPHGFEVNPQAVAGIAPQISVRLAPSLQAAAYPDEFFDGVILWHVLEHVPQPQELLAEIGRVLKPGGTLVVAVPNFSSWQARWAGPDWFHLDLPRHLYHFPVSGLRQLLASSGFEPGKVYHFSLRQNPFGWIQSFQNRLRWLPRNGIYTLLHRRQRGAELPFSRIVRLQLRLLFSLGAPIALALSVLAACCRSGATIHCVARRRAD